ncbi:MAG: GIY-YIG nuclease family protein [Chloroflexota bacterium]
MNSNELRKRLMDYREFGWDVYRDMYLSMEKDIAAFNEVDIIAGEALEDGLRVRIFFNLTEEERDLIDSPYFEWIDYPQGMLYYPTRSDWFDPEAIHIQYRSEISVENLQNYDAMLRILHKIFWLAGDLREEINRNPEKTPTTHLKGRSFVDQPELWPHLTHIFRWWDEVGLPVWPPIDFLRQTFAQIQQEDMTRQGYVYLIEGVEDWFKIGRSKEAVERIEKLGVVLPFPIETRHIIVTDDMYKAESKLHEIFSERRGRGEWFKLNADEVQAICGLKDIFFMPQKLKHPG